MFIINAHRPVFTGRGARVVGRQRGQTPTSLFVSPAIGLRRHTWARQSGVRLFLYSPSHIATTIMPTIPWGGALGGPAGPPLRRAATQLQSKKCCLPARVEEHGLAGLPRHHKRLCGPRGGGGACWSGRGFGLLHPLVLVLPWSLQGEQHPCKRRMRLRTFGSDGAARSACGGSGVSMGDWGKVLSCLPGTTPCGGGGSKAGWVSIFRLHPLH